MMFCVTRFSSIAILRCKLCVGVGRRLIFWWNRIPNAPKNRFYPVFWRKIKQKTRKSGFTRIFRGKKGIRNRKSGFSSSSKTRIPPLLVNVKDVTHRLSTKIPYTVPEVGGKRYTPQNDGERLLYMLVGPKISNFEVNRTVLIDM